MDSPWLQETLTELNRKTNAIKTLIEEDDPESGVEDPEPEATDWEKNEERMRFQVLRLIEENLLQQDMLVKRNDQKTEIIRQLSSEVECLKAEVKALQNCITCRRGDQPLRVNNRFKVSGFGRLVFRKVFGC